MTTANRILYATFSSASDLLIQWLFLKFTARSLCQNKAMPIDETDIFTS